MRKFSHLLKDASGAMAIEYGLIAALIALTIVISATTLGSNISNTFSKMAVPAVMGSYH